MGARKGQTKIKILLNCRTWRRDGQANGNRVPSGRHRNHCRLPIGPHLNELKPILFYLSEGIHPTSSYAPLKKIMPRRRTKHRTSRRRRRIRGGSKLTSWLKKANSWLRKSKAISRGTRFLANNTALPYVGKIAKYSKMAGYGRHTRGGALRLAGGSLRLAGGRRRTCAKGCRRRRKR